MYVPELLFGHLLTGSNFNDEQKRLTGGRHGYGAKLTNVFSKKFMVEIGDGHSTKGKFKTYKQIWEDNMHVCNDAEVAVSNIQTGNGKHSDYTRISFVPDLPRLTGDARVKNIPQDELKLMRRRVVDVAGCSGGKLRVTLNGEDISVSSFEEYAYLYRHQPSVEERGDSKQLPPLVYHKLNSRWEIVVGLSESKSFDEYITRRRSRRHSHTPNISIHL